MSKRIDLTEVELALLRRIEGGCRSCYAGPPLQNLIDNGLVIAQRWGRSQQFGVSITHKGRRVALGMSPDQGGDE